MTPDERQQVQHTTGTSVPTVYINSSGEQYWPCWCGNHVGEYGLNDWMQHHCTHSDHLMPLRDPYTGQFICVECGKIFNVEHP